MKQELIVNALKEIVHLEVMSKYSEAMHIVRPLLDTQNPGPRIVEAYARLSVHFNEQEKALDMLEVAFKNFKMIPQLQSNLHFQAGDLYDSVGEYDKAFAHYKTANDVIPVDFNVQAYRPFIAAMQQYFTRVKMKTLAHADDCDVLPVFIVGMPRSGTTLTEQVLDMHSQIHGAGELALINEYVATLQQRFSFASQYPGCLAEVKKDQLNILAKSYIATALENSTGSLCVTDKMPSNCGHLGMIELIFPSAKVIHCRRHPVDTCLSCYFQNFANSHHYSRRLNDLSIMYKLYLEMVRMWDGVTCLPVHELRYEKMVSDQERTSKDLVQYLGFDWEEQCLSYYNSKRINNTCSYNQVRKPIYRKSVERWKNYEKHIGPLLADLEDVTEQYIASG